MTVLFHPSPALLPKKEKQSQEKLNKNSVPPHEKQDFAQSLNEKLL